VDTDKYTYKIPNNIFFIKTLLEYLKSKKETQLYELIKGAECHIHTYGQYSRKRWDAFSATVNFKVPISKLEEFDDDIKERLRNICNLIIPEEAGFDVVQISVTPKMIEINDESLEDDLAIISDQILDKTGICYPYDLYEKGTEMAEVYLYIYHIENTLRIFIDTVGGVNLNFTSNLTHKILKRKKEESLHKWRTFRGNSDLFYLDIKDLGTLITNNWEIFKAYFPSQEWIKQKIDEIGECRNCIAHNSYIGEDEKALLKVYYNAILSQIGKNK